MMYTCDKVYKKRACVAVTAAAVKLTLHENKLRRYFQEDIIEHSLRVRVLETTSPKKRYIVLYIVYIDYG